MNRILQVIIFIVLSIGAKAQYEIYTIDDMEFEINSKNDFKCTLVGYLGNAQEITVPSNVTIDGESYTVTKIGPAVFRNNQNVDSVNLPNSLEYIGSSAFAGSSIKKIGLPPSLEYIGSSAFEGSSVKEILLPPKITTIEASTFQNCNNLRKVVLPDNLESIGGSAFWECSLESIEFPTNLKEIGSYAFYRSRIDFLRIPSSVKFIGDRAFAYNHELQVILIDEDEEELRMGERCFSDTSLRYLYLGRNISSESNVFGHLQNLTISKYVSDISFLYFTYLSQIVSEAQIPPLLNDKQDITYDFTKIIVPKELVTNYEEDKTWGFFTNIIGTDIPFKNYELSVEPTISTINVSDVLEVSHNINPEINSNVVWYFTNNLNEYSGNQILNTLGWYPNIEGIIGSNSGEADVVFILPINNKTIKTHVTVIQPATSISLNKSDITLSKGQSSNILSRVEPSDALDSSVRWFSSNEMVATVNDGEVIAVGGGECDIIATTHNGLQASCHVSVVVAPESIVLDNESMETFVGEEFTLNASVYPFDVYPSVSIVWSSSDEKIARVDTDGFVQVYAEGNCVITASIYDYPHISASCMLSSASGIEEIFLDPNEKIDIYSLEGIIIKSTTDSNYLKNLPRGLYLIKHNDSFQKLLLRH